MFNTVAINKTTGTAKQQTDVGLVHLKYLMHTVLAIVEDQNEIHCKVFAANY